ncbi:catechol 2,3-dioxygenase-like lactoylglutathione lyase family enzyme [Flavobacterium cutihirudinis]|uniref:Catechol 2,3-dioxygenase-like lactoylglutathione lyase family enzyme n=1 Tax=Flavobacterium cutihirudinis TaxID=1265740 RepID=A0A3D9FSG3_9FLAO|nr:glyoxalase [Flavobacterium cutihirudinis]RED23563.1 catechol 2,3-dioxygenase-like lactoylglutathione lyase family enzyme [Flavobacterium cutihirudinis]
MQHKIKSIRPFIGAKNFEISRSFYRDLGFEEIVLAHNFSVFKNDETAFYLQDYYAKEWIENTMIFLEVDDTERYYNELAALNLPEKYEGVKLTPVKYLDWGSECFLHDPSGVLWHFGTFKK